MTHDPSQKGGASIEMRQVVKAFGDNVVLDSSTSMSIRARWS